MRDLRPLIGIIRLERLYLAGNRVGRLRRTAGVLERVGKVLGVLDLRANAITEGFYISGHQSSGSEAESSRGSGERSMVLSQRRAPEQRGIMSMDQPQANNIASQGVDAGMQHLLPLLDASADASSRQRLDEDTALRRRVYELLVVYSCPKLEKLDGLTPPARGEVTRRDGTWDRLIELGVLRSKNGTVET